jgi:hypothetical protein
VLRKTVLTRVTEARKHSRPGKEHSLVSDGLIRIETYQLHDEAHSFFENVSDG